MPTVRGKEAVRSHINGLPGAINKMLVGAARAGATVIAEEAKARSISADVARKIKVVAKAEDSRVVGKVQVRMRGYQLPRWLEYGTHAHLISVKDMTELHGASVRRVNLLAKQQGVDHSLVIGGKFVGPVVKHPGARPHPFMRPALDAKQGEAFAAAQEYINARVTRSGIAGNSSEGGDDGGS